MAGSAIKKPRADARLLTLPEEQQQEIFAWLKVSSFEIVRGKVHEEYGFISSISALHNAWKYWSRVELESRILKSKGCADDLLELVEGDMGKLDRATMAALQQSAFELALNGGQPDVVKDLYSLILKAKKLEQDESALALKIRQYEDQIAKAKAELENAKSKGEGGLDIETIERIEQQLNML